MRAYSAQIQENRVVKELQDVMRRLYCSPKSFVSLKLLFEALKVGHRRLSSSTNQLLCQLTTSEQGDPDDFYYELMKNIPVQTWEKLCVWWRSSFQPNRLVVRKCSKGSSGQRLPPRPPALLVERKHLGHTQPNSETLLYRGSTTQYA